MVFDGHAIDHGTPMHPFQAIMQGDKGAGDRGRAGAAIRLQNIAIENDLTLP